MNYRTVLLSAMMSAVIGAGMGWGIGQIALRQRYSQVQSYLSQPYQTLYSRRIVWIGALVGMAMGAGEACVLGLRHQAYKEDS